MLHKKLITTLLIRLAFLLAPCFATIPIAFTQEVPQRDAARSAKTDSSNLPKQHLRFSLITNHNDPSLSDESYRPITAGQRLRWFMLSTFGPSHTTGVALLSAGGTAVDRPLKYEPHWQGFADRFGMSMAASAAGRAIEGCSGFFLREDPRYLRVPQLPLRARVASATEQTFFARYAESNVVPAYARYLGIVGSNFLSNSWRVHSEGNARSALLRSSEGFAGHLATNFFTEFWPDVKKHFLLMARSRALLPTKSSD